MIGVLQVNLILAPASLLFLSEGSGQPYLGWNLIPPSKRMTSAFM